MDLIEVYIQEVTRRLPEKMRKDIAMELRSNIEDMLPDDYSKEDVKRELEKLGNPSVLAAQYKDRPMHLIGPKFYDSYITIMKLVLPIVAIVVFIIFVIENMVANIGTVTPLPMIFVTLFGEAIWVLLEAAIQVFFWVTITFMILERTIEPSVHVPLTLSGKKWTPHDLENLPNIPLKKAIGKGEVFFSFFWTVIWAVLYFNATNLIGIYQTSEAVGLKMVITIFDEKTLISYWAIVVVLIILEILRTIYKAIARQWTYKLAINNAVVHLISFVVLIIITSNPDLLNSELASYMANLIDSPLETIDTAILWITWTIVITVIVTGLIDIYTGFRKAMMK